MEGFYVSAVAVLLPGLLAFYALYKLFVSKHKNLPPGPRGLQALRSVLHALKEGNLHKQAWVWSEQYGELVLCRTVMGDLCFLNSARLVREMFASKNLELLTNDRPPTFLGWYALYGYRDILTDSVSPEWSKKRRLFHQTIKIYGDGIERFEGTVQTELRRLVSKIEDSAGEEMDMEDLLSSSLLCVLAVLMTGESPGPESTIPQRMKEFDDAVNDLARPTIDAVLAMFPFLRFVPGTRYREICQTAIAKRDACMDEVFTKTKESHTPGQPRGIVDAFLDAQLKEENQWLTDDHIRGMFVNIIAAGYLTSLQTLKALFLCLVHNPEVALKLQKEIDVVIGNRPIGVEDRRLLPYTEAVVLETLRYSSITPVAFVHQTRTDVALDGFSIPKGSMVFPNLWTIHHDPQVWSQPLCFRPERFLDDVTGTLLPAIHPVRQSFLPFSVGKRMCPGETFGRTRVFLYVTTLLQNFDILPPVKRELPPPDPELYINGAVLQPRPYSLIFRPRV
ncbi:hypothetical protein BaRGS_00040269 [Batillaria attramentaria]|uniref:Cytochrome P450 n=1 Tax=Batillaria attramentaria TaxID=370345 RepID=A0ABD0J0Z0_9CAEN